MVCPGHGGGLQAHLLRAKGGPAAGEREALACATRPVIQTSGTAEPAENIILAGSIIVVKPLACQECETKARKGKVSDKLVDASGKNNKDDDTRCSCGGWGRS